ncbi:MAG TPA: hypothetical protein VJP77_05300 [Planctomycetota bacterium]|nr:hypothetical protein [Planctomycetota bacterium]
MKKLLLLLPLAAGLGVGERADGAILRLSLDQIVVQTDNAVDGEIVARNVYRVDHPTHGPEVYYTVLTLAGRSLADGRALTVDVAYLGGFVSETEGVWNSEAPADQDVQHGKRVVAFYKWVDDFGAGVAGNILYTSHGSLFRVVEGPSGAVVLGRGDGYPIQSNLKVDSLGSAVRSILETAKSQSGQAGQ